MKKTDVMFIWLFLTALLLTMTTYAWFTTNRIFEIESFDIHVVSRGGLEISTDGINWKGVVGIIDFIDANNTYPNNVNQIPNSIKPVSTIGEVERGRQKIFYGEVDPRGLNSHYLRAYQSLEQKCIGEDCDGHFVTFDIFLKSFYKRKVTIGSESKISYIEGNTSGIENSFRVGFLNQGNLAEDAQIGRIQELNNANKTYIWEQNYDIHKPSAVTHAKKVYNITTTETNASRLNYYGVAKEIKYEDNVKVEEANSNFYPNFFRLVTPDIYTKENNQENSYLFDIEPGITKVRVYVWIEGQDVDCEDGSSQGKLQINLQFIAE